MKLKALLLGSAAGMMSVAGVSTSATAADAVVAEPHPVEYVRVCDMYGAGYFYIPGTETCLKFDGYVRTTYAYTDPDGNAQSSAEFRTRARLNIRTRNETDYGTLEGWIRLQGGEAGNGTNDAGVGVDRALISLAGFRLGYSDSYITTHHGYGTFLDKNDGHYDYHQATFLDYTYAANGFSATLGVQMSSGGLQFGGNNARGIPPQVVADTLADARALDLYAGVGYTGSWGGVAASIIQDNEADEWAWKVSADVNIVEGLKLRGWYAADDGDTKYVTGNGGFGTVGADTRIEDQWGVSAQYKFNDMFAVNLGYTATDSSVAGLEDDYIGVGLDIRPVPGLIIRPEAYFGDTADRYSIRVYRTF